MASQYKRVYELTIISKTGEVRIIRDLRVSFEITKTKLSFPNLAKIVIYNPNSKTLAILQNKFTKVVLNAGYEGGMRLLFKGEIRNVFQSKINVDRQITLYAGDGERDWQNSVFNKTFTENVSIDKVINDVLNTFKNLTVGVVQGLPTAADKLRGQTLSGSSKDILDGFAREYGFDWNIQDGEIIIVPIEQSLQSNEAVLINAATGMVGSPTITEIGSNITTLLNPRLIPNSAYKIESVNQDVQMGNLFFREIKKTTAEGLYKVEEVLFKGDSREGDWTSFVKGRVLANG